jgi:nucleoside-diphosphate-sugar epimerase
MKQALVIGASGGFGGAVARELVGRGWKVRALRRRGGKPLGQLSALQEIEGDALEPADVARAAEGVDVIVHGYNSPYPRWAKTQLRAARAVAAAAVHDRARIVLPGNVYGLGPDFTRPLDESASRQAPTAKGRIRNAVEAELERATTLGARLLNVRCGDYLGPNAGNTWFHFMTKNLARGGALLDPGSPGVLHEWAYLPDVAATVVALLERESELGQSETFHMSSYQLTSTELLEAIQRELPSPRRVRRLPWTLLSYLGVVAPMLRELADMKYLWDQPVLLDDRKLRHFLPNRRVTPLPQAIRASLGLPPVRDSAREEASVIMDG